MREIYRNPMLYYVLAPILVAAWPLLVRFMYLPAAERSSRQEQALCLEGQACILEVLKFDPERLTFTGSPEVSGEFQYAKAIDRVANLCAIPSSSYNYSAGSIITANNKKSQQARVSLTNVGIVQAATFVSTIQSMWVNLKCDKVKLTKKEGMPDQWDTEMTFWYTF